MVQRWHRRGPRAWLFVLALLLLVPLFAQAHAHHGEVAKPAACAACVVAHQSPALAAPPVSCPAPALQAVALHPAPSTALLAIVVHAHGGRAPPALLPTRFA